MLIITLHYISLKNLDKTRKYILLIYKYIHTHGVKLTRDFI